MNEFKSGWLEEPNNPKHHLLENEAYFTSKLQPLSTTTLTSDLREYSSPRHNQKTTSSCVAQSAIKALEIKRNIQYGKAAHKDLSILALYYLCRELSDPPKTHIDGGTHVSFACDVLRRFGVCEEASWPFNPSKVNAPPPWAAMRKAYVNRITAFKKISSTGKDRVDSCIKVLSKQEPIIYGTRIDKQWHSYSKNKTLTKADTSNIIGGHATVLVGWDGSRFIGENSWGTEWGDNGYYYMAPEVIASSEASDFWMTLGGWELWNNE